MEFTGIVKSNIHLSDSDSSNSTKLTQLPTESSGSESNSEQEVQEPRRERPQIEDYVAINNDRDLGPTEDDETDRESIFICIVLDTVKEAIYKTFT